MSHPYPGHQLPVQFPGLTSKKSGVWTSTDAFQPQLVNQNVNLHSLGIANFRGIYSTEVSLGNVMKNIVRICKLHTKTITISARNPAKVRFEINGTWISDGVADTEKQARVASINNSLIYLIHHKGFQITAAEQVPPNAVMKVSQQELLVDFNNYASVEENFEAVRLKAAQFVHEFLMNPSMMKLELCIANLSQHVFQDIVTTLCICKVTHKKVDDNICCWKVNSTYHNLFDRPLASLAARVPTVERMLVRKRQKNKETFPGGVTIGKIIDKSGEKNIFSEQGELKTQEQTGLGEGPLALNKKDKKKDKRKAKVSAVQSQKLPTGTNPLPLDTNSLNPEILSNKFQRFFKGFAFLVKGWKDHPLFLLEKSAMCSNFLCKFAVEPSETDSDHNVTIKLTMSNHNNGDTFWVSMCKGKTFAEAKNNCASIAVNFLRGKISKTAQKWNATQWSMFLQKFDDPDHVWSFSKKDLGTDFLLSTSYRIIQEDNIGYKMLRNLGWSPNTGIGKYRQGALNPIEVYVGYSGYTGLGYSGYTCKVDKAESGSILGSIALEEVLIRFKNNFTAWKLKFVDVHNVDDGQIILLESGKQRLKSVFYEEQGIASVWKPIFQAMGIMTERWELLEDEEEISDEESLIPAARRYLEESVFEYEVPGTSSTPTNSGVGYSHSLEDDADEETIYGDDDIDGENVDTGNYNDMNDLDGDQFDDTNDGYGIDY